MRIAVAVIIDSRRHKHHYYLMLISSNVKGAPKNSESDPVLAYGLVSEVRQPPSLRQAKKIRSGEIQWTK